jgi:hypothetical protein
MYKINLNLDNLLKSDPTVDYMAINVLPEAWNLIPQKIIDVLIKSMPSRMQAIIDVEGWWTKY